MDGGVNPFEMSFLEGRKIWERVIKKEEKIKINKDNENQGVINQRSDDWIFLYGLSRSANFGTNISLFYLLQKNKKKGCELYLWAEGMKRTGQALSQKASIKSFSAWNTHAISICP